MFLTDGPTNRSSVLTEFPLLKEQIMHSMQPVHRKSHMSTYTAGETHTLTSDLTLFAIWEPDRQITYLPNGMDSLGNRISGTGTMAPSYAEGDSGRNSQDISVQNFLSRKLQYTSPTVSLSLHSSSHARRLYAP